MYKVWCGGKGALYETKEEAEAVAAEIAKVTKETVAVTEDNIEGIYDDEK